MTAQDKTSAKQQLSSYRQILKATSLFGGVQVFNILLSIVRSKVIAVLLGPAGMGIGGLFTSTTGVISVLSGLGLSTSAIKDIAAADATGDTDRIAVVATVFRRLMWLTGIAGTLITLILAPWLSELAFGSDDHTLGFVAIAGTLLLGQLAAGQRVLLQGTRKLKELAKASVLGTAAGLAIAIPLYWRFGFDGIVPAIVAGAVTDLLVAMWYGRKVKIIPAQIDLRTTFAEASGMIKMGIVIALNGLLVNGTAYVLRIFISWAGTLDDVGLYSAGFSIINSYVGMVFTAMLADYYPRLSAVAHDNERCAQTVNQQADIAILLVGPIILSFLVLIQLAVVALYSGKFVAITDMMYWAGLGILFKAASWPVGFVFVPKGDSRLFIISEMAANLYTLLLNMGGYYWFGLEGLGISFFVSYAVYWVQVVLTARWMYDFRYDPSFYKIFATQLSLAILCFAIIYTSQPLVAYGVGGVLTVISATLSYHELDKRVGVKAAVAGMINKLKGKLRAS